MVLLKPLASLDVGYRAMNPIMRYRIAGVKIIKCKVSFAFVLDILAPFFISEFIRGDFHKSHLMSIEAQTVKPTEEGLIIIFLSAF